MEEEKAVAAGNRAVLLFSAGLDSTTSLALLTKEGYELIPLYIAYGHYAQEAELERAKKITSAYNLPLFIHHFSYPVSSHPLFSSSPLCFQYIQGKVSEDAVPLRNAIFGIIAGIYAVMYQAEYICLSVSYQNAPYFPDTSEEFLKVLQRLINISLFFGEERIKVIAPLAGMERGEVLALAKELGVPLDLTISCFHPVKQGDSFVPCGKCSACLQK